MFAADDDVGHAESEAMSHKQTPSARASTDQPDLETDPAATTDSEDAHSRRSEDYTNPNYQRTVQYADFIVEECKPPDETFDASDIGQWAVGNLRALQTDGLIEAVGERTHTWGTGDTSIINVYRINPAVFSDAQDIVKERSAYLPCGHSGFKNLNGDTYVCGYDHCTEQYSREDVSLK